MEVTPGYRTTEVGVIPKEWEVLPISFLTWEFRGGAPFKPTDFTDRGVKVLPKGGVGRTGVLRILDKDLQYCRPEYAAAHPRNQVDRAFTIVVLRDLVPSGPSIGLMVEIDTQESFVLAQGVYGFKVNTERADPRYLIQLSNTNWYRKLANSIMVGSTQVHITNTAFKKATLPVPPLPEQRAIATALSDVDALLAKLDALISKKRDLKLATMQQLLTGQTRLPGFSGEWEAKRLGDLASFHKGKGLPKNSLTPSGVEQCIHYGELFTLYPETIGEIFSRTNDSRDSFRSCANDVLMPTSDVTPRGLAKASCVTVEGVILGGDILVIRAESGRINGTFLSYVIRHHEGQILQLVSGSTVFHLYGSDMKKFTFLMPTFNEQTVIATVLSDMDDELNALEARRDKTQALKQGMMQELLTGRIRLV
jgi:type I restriction enzyme S subunit